MLKRIQGGNSDAAAVEELVSQEKVCCVKIKGLIIGQAPGPNNGKKYPLTGDGEKRLARLCGYRNSSELWRYFDRINLLDEFPGRQRSGGGDRFPAREAREAASRIVLTSRPVVFLLGRGVAKAFGLSLGLLQRKHNIIVLPHPSGVNHFWNEASATAVVAVTVRNTLRSSSLLPSLKSLQQNSSD